MRWVSWIAAGVLFVSASARAFYEDLGGVFEGDPEHPAIGYQGPTSDPVAALNRKIWAG
jgi:hypothetical protein